MPNKITHDYKCENCGDIATRSIEREVVEFPIFPNGDFGEKRVIDAVDDNGRSYCDNCDY